MSKKRIVRTDEEKKEILDYVDEHGPIAAEKKFKIKRNQIYNWRSESGRSARKGTTLESRKKRSKKKKTSPTTPDSPRVSQVSRQRRDRTEKRSKKRGIKSLRYAAVLEHMAEDAMYEDKTDEALALFAGASALRGKAIS